MAFLLDTHALIWWLEDAPALSRRARAILEDQANPVWFSAASIYEIHWKINIGKLAPRPSPREACAKQGITELPISAAHAEYAAMLDPAHRDPWDRLIVAQAREHTLTVITRDQAIATLGAPVVW